MKQFQNISKSDPPGKELESPSIEYFQQMHCTLAEMSDILKTIRQMLLLVNQQSMSEIMKQDIGKALLRNSRTMDELNTTLASIHSCVFPPSQELND
jgi:hypothetical protein